jgi:hypothetical protein
VGCSHGGTAEASSGRGAANVRGQDANTGRDNVDTGAVVGERGNLEGAVRGADGDGVGRAAGRHAGHGLRAAEGVAVAGGGDGDDALGEGGLDGVGPGGGCGAAEGQVDCGLGGAALGGDVVDGPVVAGEDGGGGAGRALEDLDGDEVGLLCDAVGGPADGAGDVGAVAEGVGVGAADGVVAKGRASAELGVGDDHTGVDDVGVGALASGRVVDVGGGGAGFGGVGPATPGSTALGGQSLLLGGLVDLLDVVVEVGNCVRLDEGNLY